MKLKRKKRLLLSLSGLLVLLLTNCEKDYEESTTNYNLTTSRFDIRVLDSEQILSNAKVMDELQKIAGQTKAQATGTGTPIGTSRILYNSTYGFSVNTAYVKYVEDTTTGKHSYNFPLTRDSLVTSHLENLLLSSRSDGSYDAYIVEYGFSKDEYNAVSQTTLNNTTTRYYPIDFDTSVFNSGELNKMVLEYSCVEIWSLEVVPAHQGDNTGGELYTEEWVLVSNECTWNYYDDGTDGSSGSTTTTTGVETSGGVGGSAGGTSTTGDSSDSGNNTDIGDTCKGCGDSDIISSPATEPAEEPETPCDRIKAGTGSAAYKQKFKALNTPEKFNLDHETGFCEQEINGVKQYVDGVADGTNHLKILPGSMNGTHVHNNKPETDTNGNTFDAQIKMLSPGDLKQLLGTCQNANGNTPENAFVIMISNEGIFAITIAEPIGALSEETKTFLRGWKEGYEDKAKEILREYSTLSARKEQLQKMFLKALKKMQLDNKVALFEGQVENEDTSDINNYTIAWTQKTLKNTFFGLTIEETPCD
ncbi:hypothetical protein DI487_07865 [Flavobacterium sediminis]|uniref:Lipoprotein n=1 Tax=Flavobacterium sediminis TaxID=2201181 RepID=A0A2U8QV78_9FLAO|nr:hypothetical protein [Flavobacterium sediminis]AWM13786.1 hypothetical protein DI487_07865 [Flavobacterium sediminis]